MLIKKLKKTPTAQQTQNGVTVIKRIDPYRKMSLAEKKEIKRMIKKAHFQHKIADSAQRTIPYRAMERSGLCIVGNSTYNRTIEFGDVNYHLAKNDDKEAIFSNWCNILNSFDPSLSVQLSFINQKLDRGQFEKDITFKDQGDGLDPYRKEYTKILHDKLGSGNNGLVKRKFVTFGIESDSKDAAILKLERMESELINSFQQTLQSTAKRCNGYERMELLHDLYNMGTERKLNFNWNMVAETGLNTKDFIAPSCFEFKGKNHFGLEKQFGRVSYLQIDAAELSDQMLSDLLGMDSPQVITLHIQTVDRTKSLKQVKDILSNIQEMKITEQMKANRAGYDMDILPPDLVDFESEAQELLDNLQSRDERMFLVTVLMMQFGETLEELENRWFIANQICQGCNCELVPLAWQQEAGLIASSPIGVNEVHIQRILTTASTGIFIPFHTQELCMEKGHYYGVNAVSKNMILIDRKAADNQGGLILGKSGSGKSFAAKREMLNAFLVTTDDILINDPEREYTALTYALGGQVIKLAPESKHHINPLDINLDVRNNEDRDYDPIRNKSDFMLSFCEQILGGKEGLQPIEKTVIDRCMQLIYADYLKNPTPENMPILEDLYKCLLNQPEPEANRIATGLELYVIGSLNVFNHHTNVDINNRMVCFDVKDLGKHLKKLGMLVVQDQIWNRVTINRMNHKYTRYYVDEFHLLLREPETAAGAVEMWKRFRKWGGMPTGITQQVADLLMSPEIEGIIANSDFFYLLSQAPTDIRHVVEMMGLSPQEVSYIQDAQKGTGVLKFRGTIIPYEDRFPENTELYKLMSTKMEDASA